MKIIKILCPECAKSGSRSQLLGKAENVTGSGYLLLWCKKCRKEIKISLAEIPKKL